MIICFDARFLGAEGTGIRRYSSELLSHLLEINDRNHFLVLTPKDACSQMALDQRPNVDVLLSNARVARAQQQLSVPLQLRSCKMDVYHYPFYDPPLIPGTPLVVTIHDLKYVKFPWLFPGIRRMKSIMIRSAMRVATQRASAVIAVSKHTKEDVVNLLHVPAHKVHVVYEGVSRLPPSNDPTRAHEYLRSLGVGPESYYLFVGELRPHKNVVRLIEAFAQMGNNSIKLLIVGKRYSNYCLPMRRVQALGMQNRVQFLSLVTDAQLAVLYRHALAVVLPSLYEGFGLPILEAMSVGTPIIASSRVSLPEVAGDAALIVDPLSTPDIRNALVLMAENGALRTRLAGAGRRRSEQFSWKEAAAKTLQVYKSVMYRRSD